MTAKLDKDYWTEELRDKFASEIYGKFFEESNFDGPRIYIREFIDLMLYTAAIFISSPAKESAEEDYNAALDIYSERLRLYVKQLREKHNGTGWNAFDMLHISLDNARRQATHREEQGD